MLLYISSQSTLKALGHTDTEVGLCIMARAALEKRGGGARAGCGDCQGEGGPSQICDVHVYMFFFVEEGDGVLCVHMCTYGWREVGWVVVGDQPNYTWLIQSNRSGPK